MTVNQAIQQIAFSASSGSGGNHLPDAGAMERARQRWDSLAKPLGGLGLLEDMVVRIAGVSGSEDIDLARRTLLLFCADNGVVERGVSQSDASVTAAVAKALGEGTSTVNYMARQARCMVRPVDVGMRWHPLFPGLEDRCVLAGTGDIAQGPAMTRAQCVQAIETGIALVEEEKAAGTGLLLTGEMGIGNTTTSCAVASVLLGQPPRKLAGRGAGLSDAGLERKVQAVEDALAANRPDPSDVVGVLSKVGGLDLAALCGVCLGGAYFRIPVLLDGTITLTAALCAVRLCPPCLEALLPGHLAAEPAAKEILSEWKLGAPITAGLRLGEGTGAVAALSLLDLTLQVYNSRHTFDRLGIEPYQNLGGR